MPARSSVRGTGELLSFRLARIDPDTIVSDGPLFENYREMAIANGVALDDPSLVKVRT